MAAGWDEAVEAIQKREARRRSPSPTQKPGRPRRAIYGMPGRSLPGG